MLGVTKRILKLFLNARFSTGSRAEAEVAEERVVAAMDRLEAELGGRDYLVGDSFSVADLTAAALFYPLVLPPQTPWRPTRLPEPLARLQAGQRDRPGYQWVTEIYRRHR